MTVAGFPSVSWLELLEVARHAPSPHNTQPWKLRPTGGRSAELLLDRARALPHEDVTGSFVVAALGMFVETLRLVAAARGWRLTSAVTDAAGALAAAARPLEPDASAAPTRLAPFARLELVPDPGARPDFTEAEILARQTSRLAPEPGPAPPALLQALELEAERGGQRVTLLDDPAAVGRLMRANLDAVVEDLNTPRYRDEIVEWMRFGRRQERRTADGLSARCMRIPRHEMAFLARFPGIARWGPTAGLARALYARRLGRVPRLIVLSGPFWEADEAVGAGRCLMRLWLHLTRHGWYIHPFGNLVTNLDARRVVEEIAETPDPWIVFRAGSTPAPPRSLRLPAAELLLA